MSTKVKRMVKLRCPDCGKDFEYSWWEWFLKAPIHHFRKRLTKCPHCGSKNWVERDKED